MPAIVLAAQQVPFSNGQPTGEILNVPANVILVLLQQTSSVRTTSALCEVVREQESETNCLRHHQTVFLPDHGVFVIIRFEISMQR